MVMMYAGLIRKTCSRMRFNLFFVLMNADETVKALITKKMGGGGGGKNSKIRQFKF
jgi:hypothetical protein